MWHARQLFGIAISFTYNTRAIQRSIPRWSHLNRTPTEIATVTFAGNDFFIGVTPSGHAMTLDLNSERHVAPSPLELLLIALGGCTGVDVVSILKKKRELVTDYRVEVGGDRRDEYPRSFTKLRVHHVLTGHNLSRAAVARAIELSEQKYCSVAATLRPAAEITTSFEIIEAAE
jgi:putative redox protein